MSLGTIILIILVIALLGGFSGIGGGPFYGTGYYGGGGLGLVIVILLICCCSGSCKPASIVRMKRHGRARPGHPRSFLRASVRTWMPGTRPGMMTMPDLSRLVLRRQLLHRRLDRALPRHHSPARPCSCEQRRRRAHGVALRVEIRPSPASRSAASRPVAPGRARGDSGATAVAMRSLRR